MIEMSHPRDWNLNQGRGLQSPSINSDPEGEISLSYMDRLMMDCLSPTLSSFLLMKHKNVNLTLKILLIGFRLILSSECIYLST